MADLKILISRKVINTLTQNLEHGKSIFCFTLECLLGIFVRSRQLGVDLNNHIFWLCGTISKIKGDVLQQGNIAIDVHTKIITIIQQIRRLLY